MKKLTDILKEIQIKGNPAVPYIHALQNNQEVKMGDLSSIYNIIEGEYNKINKTRYHHGLEEDEIMKIINSPLVKKFLQRFAVRNNGFATNEELLEFLENNLEAFIEHEDLKRYDRDDEDKEDLDTTELTLDLIYLDQSEIGGIIWDGIEIGRTYSCIPSEDPGSFHWGPISFNGKKFYTIHYNI